MKNNENLEDIAQELEENDLVSSDDLDTVENLVDRLVELGNLDQVFVTHDDHLGLKDNLPSDLLELSLPLSNTNAENFEDEIKEIVDQANIIIPLVNRDMTDDLTDDIRDDKLSRGESIED